MLYTRHIPTIATSFKVLTFWLFQILFPDDLRRVDGQDRDGAQVVEVTHVAMP